MHGSYISFRRPDPFGRSDRHTRKKENRIFLHIGSDYKER
jgi:hypothetical protein